MSRSILLAATLLLTATAALARPLLMSAPLPVPRPFLRDQQEARPVDLSAIGRFRDQTGAADRPTVDGAASGMWTRAAAVPGISLGSMQVEIGGINGSGGHAAGYRLDGLGVFGSSLAGSVNNRGAQIKFIWPTNH